jgi:hypothetical protein
MELVLGWIVACLIEWALLLIVIPIARRLADFSMPGPVEMAWKLLVIVLLKNLVGTGATYVLNMPFLGSIIGAVIFWVGMVKVFEIDFFGAVIIMVVSWVLQYIVVAALLAVVCGAL